MHNLAIGARIREERERLGFSQPAFAALADASKRSQIGWEQGRSFPDAAVMSAWSAAGADVSYIITGMRVTPPNAPVLNRREAALLDNYRHTSEEGKAVVEATALAAAKPLKNKKAV